MFGTLGGPEVILILVIALIVFGPRRLPEIGKSMGKMLAEFRKASNDFKRTIEDEIEAENRKDVEAARLPPAEAATAAVPAAPPTESPGAPIAPEPPPSMASSLPSLSQPSEPPPWAQPAASSTPAASPASAPSAAPSGAAAAKAPPPAVVTPEEVIVSREPAEKK
jgi:TatA/E family protein of Tat protein translocase